MYACLTQTISARKNYYCAGCGGAIEKRTQNLLVSEADDEEIWESRYHLECYGINLDDKNPFAEME